MEEVGGAHEAGWGDGGDGGDGGGEEGEGDGGWAWLIMHGMHY